MLIIGKSNLYRISRLQQNALNPLNGSGKNIAIHISRYNGNPHPLCQIRKTVIIDIGTASLNPSNNALIFKNADCVPDRLTAYAEHVLKRILRIHLLSRNKLFHFYLFIDPLNQLQVLGGCLLHNTPLS